MKLKKINIVTILLFNTLIAQADSKFNDSEIIGVVKTANMGEIDLASQAKSHLSNQKVKDFANMMMDHHRQSNKEIDKISSKNNLKPQDTKLTADLKATAKTEKKTLKTTSGAEYDREYIHSQVKMHQTVLSTLDDLLIPQVKNEELKTLLEKTRSTVADHLTQAKEIESTL